MSGLVCARPRVAVLTSAILLLMLSIGSHWAQAQTLTVLHNFTGTSDGASPYAGLTIDRGGNLYGTASGGPNCEHGCGVVYRLKRAGTGWVFSPLVSLTGQNGAIPLARVIFGPDGALYGTTSAGGAFGGGIVFKLVPPPTICAAVSCPWIETILHDFHDIFSNDDGSTPGNGDVIFDPAGHLLGTTVYGYGGLCTDATCGGVYELTHTSAGWQASLVYSFSQGPGYHPPSGVVLDGTGDLYGVTSAGDAAVYELSPVGGGWSETTLSNFGNNVIEGGLSRDQAGNLFGTTEFLGPQGGGTVFEISPSGGEWVTTTLYAFTGTYPQIGPTATLTRDGAGNLYGVTNQLGAHGFGNVFKLTRSGDSWTYSSIYDFTGGADGGGPWGQVILDTSGNIYGTTLAGGSNGLGVVFEITP